MKHRVQHNLDQATAKLATQKALERYREKFPEANPNLSWISDERGEVTFGIKGMSLKGTIDLQPKLIELELEVPFMLRMFKKQALGVIEKEIRKWIGKAEAGEL